MGWRHSIALLSSLAFSLAAACGDDVPSGSTLQGERGGCVTGDCAPDDGDAASSVRDDAEPNDATTIPDSSTADAGLASETSSARDASSAADAPYDASPIADASAAPDASVASDAGD